MKGASAFSETCFGMKVISPKSSTRNVPWLDTFHVNSGTLPPCDARRVSVAPRPVPKGTDAITFERLPTFTTGISEFATIALLRWRTSIPGW